MQPTVLLKYLAIFNSKSIFFSLIKYRVTLLIFLFQISPFLAATQEDLLPFDIQFGLRLFCIE